MGYYGDGTAYGESVPPSKELLTEEESSVLRKLAAAWSEFIKLPEIHGSDNSEFLLAIHMAQNIVLARPATRIEQQKREALLWVERA